MFLRPGSPAPCMPTLPGKMQRKSCCTNRQPVIWLHWQEVEGSCNNVRCVWAQTMQTRCLPDAVTGAADSHCSSVNALAVCGDLLCSAGGDAMIRVWKARTLEFVRYGMRGAFFFVILPPDWW